MEEVNFIRPRPSWDEYFFMMAKIASLRSHDAETQHGCVLVSEDNKILSTGYNGLPKGLKRDWDLPNTRPEKYKWMRHSEQNAVWNLMHPVKNMTAYVTGECCNDCLMAMWQAGVTKVFYIDTHGSFKISNEDREVRKIFLEKSGMGFYPVGYINLDWLNYESWLNNRSS